MKYTMFALFVTCFLFAAFALMLDDQNAFFAFGVVSIMIHLHVSSVHSRRALKHISHTEL